MQKHHTSIEKKYCSKICAIYSTVLCKLLFTINLFLCQSTFPNISFGVMHRESDNSLAIIESIYNFMKRKKNLERLNPEELWLKQMSLKKPNHIYTF